MRTSLTEWHRRVALDIAQAFPLTPAVRVRADGNHLTAQNDEPEPDEAALLAADLQRNENKGERLARQNDERAIEAQLIDFRARGLV
jgi:hypothetical protein